MAIAHVGTETDAKVDATSTTFTFTMSGGAASDDNILVAFICKDGSDAQGIDGYTGWTRIFEDIAPDGGTVTSAAFYKVASSEGTTYDFTTTGSSRRWKGCIVEISGADTTTPLDTHTVNSLKNASITATGLTTANDDTFIISALGHNSTSNTITLDASLADVFNDPNIAASGEDIGAAAGWEIQATAGATGDYTHTILSGRSTTATVIAIAPASSGTITTQTAEIDIPLTVGMTFEV